MYSRLYELGGEAKGERAANPAPLSRTNRRGSVAHNPACELVLLLEDDDVLLGSRWTPCWVQTTVRPNHRFEKQHRDGDSDRCYAVIFA
jgi:hypothetical protein